MVLLRAVSDDGTLRELVERHRDLTGSDVAAALLTDWDTSVTQFVEVMPHDLLRIAAERDPELEGARG
jgi:glutamate synthase domain-containing protein 3